jgi:hypothetical protein
MKMHDPESEETDQNTYQIFSIKSSSKQHSLSTKLSIRPKSTLMHISSTRYQHIAHTLVLRSHTDTWPRADAVAIVGTLSERKAIAVTAPSDWCTAPSV